MVIVLAGLGDCSVSCIEAILHDGERQGAWWPLIMPQEPHAVLQTNGAASTRIFDFSRAFFVMER